MAYPASYTESTFAQFMHDMITNDDKVSEFTSTLRWSVERGSYAEAINETLAVYGTGTITGISGRANLRRLRAIGRVELWRLVMQRAAAFYQAADGTTTVSRNQIWEHAKAMYEMFLAEAVTLYGITVYSNARPIQSGPVALRVSMV